MAIIGSFTHMNLASIDGDKFSFLTCAQLQLKNLGAFARIMYGIGLFASGMSSTVSGSLTGQRVLSGFFPDSWMTHHPRTRIFITRTVALIPCLFIVSYATQAGANLVQNIVQAIQLPFVLIPMMKYMRNTDIMNGKKYNCCKFYFIQLTSFIIIGLNFWTIFVNFTWGWTNIWMWNWLIQFGIYLGFLLHQATIHLNTDHFKLINNSSLE